MIRGRIGSDQLSSSPPPRSGERHDTRTTTTIGMVLRRVCVLGSVLVIGAVLFACGRAPAGLRWPSSDGLSAVSSSKPESDCSRPTEADDDQGRPQMIRPCTRAAPPRLFTRSRSTARVRVLGSRLMSLLVPAALKPNAPSV